MQSTKIVKLLIILTPTEFRRFRKFLQSPFHTTNTNLLPLYEEFSKYHPDFTSPRLSRERIFEKAFPKTSFSAVRYNKLTYELTLLVEDYLLHLEIHRDDFRRRRMLNTIYGKRNQYEFFKKETKALLVDLEAIPFRDFEYYKAQSELNYEYYFHVLTPKHTLKDTAISELTTSIDRKLVLEKLRIASELKSRERTLATKYDIRFLEEILDENDAGFMEDNLSVGLFRLLFQLFEQDRQLEAFNRLKEGYSKAIQRLRNEDQSLFFVNLINFAAQQINSGDTAFYKEALDLYKLALEVDLLIESERMHEAIFANIVIMGCHEGEFIWVEKFIDNYQKYLDETIKPDVVTHSRGLWYFYQNDFHNAYDQFFNYNFSHVWQPSARNNLIRTLYELFLLDESYFDVLMAQMEAFERFLNRSKVLNDFTKTAYLNFIFVIKNLTNGIYIQKDRVQLEESISKLIQAKKSIVAKGWLKKKLEELKL